MILKIGYYESGGTSSYKYYENFNNLVVSSYETMQNIYKDDECSYNGLKVSPDYWGFDSSCIENEMYLNFIWFYEKSTGKQVLVVALAGTVFLMNENGTTIDKY